MGFAFWQRPAANNILSQKKRKKNHPVLLAAVVFLSFLFLTMLTGVGLRCCPSARLFVT